MPHEETAEHEECRPGTDEVSSAELFPENQEAYARYLEQQRRMSCPGCGEGEEFF